MPASFMDSGTLNFNWRKTNLSSSVAFNQASSHYHSSVYCFKSFIIDLFFYWGIPLFGMPLFSCEGYLFEDQKGSCASSSFSI